MLHHASIEPETLTILKSLLAIDELSDYALAGGTALALKYGHRKSVDLELFGLPTDIAAVKESIKKYFGRDAYLKMSQIIGQFLHSLIR